MLTQSTGDDDTDLFIIHIIEELNAFVTIGEDVHSIDSTTKMRDSVLTITTVLIDVTVQPDQDDILDQLHIGLATSSRIFDLGER